MTDLSLYRFIPLVRYRRFSLLRGFGRDDTVLMMRPLSAEPDAATRECLQNDLALTRRMDVRFAAPALRIVRHDARPCLLLADPGGEPLEAAVGRPFDLPRFLRVAIAVAGALEAVHAHGIVHGVRPPVDPPVRRGRLPADRLRRGAAGRSGPAQRRRRGGGGARAGLCGARANGTDGLRSRCAERPLLAGRDAIPDADRGAAFLRGRHAGVDPCPSRPSSAAARTLGPRRARYHRRNRDDAAREIP